MTNTNNESEDQQSATDAIGVHLARERNKRGISVRQVSEQIKLPGWIIQAIEADEFDRIAPVFLRGYIRNYADCLGLDPRSFMTDLPLGEDPELRPVLPVNQAGIRLERLIKYSTYLLVTTLIIPPLIYFFVVGGVQIFENEVVGATSINADPAQSINVSQRIAEALASAEPAQNEAEPGHMAASAVPLSSIRSLEAQDSEEKSSAESDRVSDIDLRTTLARLELEMTEDSWVEIESADGQRLEFDLLKAGTRHQYQALPPFKLLLGRASAVRISIDGRSQSFPGQDRRSVVEVLLGEHQVEPVTDPVADHSD